MHQEARRLPAERRSDHRDKHLILKGLQKYLPVAYSAVQNSPGGKDPQAAGCIVKKNQNPVTTSELPWGYEEEDREWEAELAVGCYGKYFCFCRTVLAAVIP